MNKIKARCNNLNEFLEKIHLFIESYGSNYKLFVNASCELLIGYYPNRYYNLIYCLCGGIKTNDDPYGFIYLGTRYEKEKILINPHEGDSIEKEVEEDLTFIKNELKRSDIDTGDIIFNGVDYNLALIHNPKAKKRTRVEQLELF